MTAKKKTRGGANTRVKAEAAIRRAREKEKAQRLVLDAIADKRLFNVSYRQIALELVEEGVVEHITAAEVRRRYLNHIRRTDKDDDAHKHEVQVLETAAAKVLTRMRAMEDTGDSLMDLEVYAKLADTYLKYRDRIARLTGLDQGGNQGGKKVIEAQTKTGALAPGQASEQHLHLHMPPSIEAYQQWRSLSEHGLTQLAHDVLALEAAAEPDPLITGLHNDAAGTTLAPNVDITPEAERQAVPASSLEALALLERESA